ncbi:MAG TPA: 3-deoxy-D-manno-octulosonic acid transferase [Verrucomicrobiae bacterium]|nr:3-deoxy-D-manno-octulosonic acid transferase [Verrucomicrobiae bacterium]
MKSAPTVVYSSGAMIFIYNILFLLFFILSAPFYFLKMWRRGGWRSGFGERFARYPDGFRASLGEAPVLWLHAVSMGEVGVCLQLIGALEKRLPGWQILVSTTTSTGMGELARRLPPHIRRVYYPIDFPGNVRRAFDVIRPRAIVLVEAEIWPNFLWQAGARGVPLFLVNARISERSFAGYRRFGFVFKPMFARFRGVGSQQEADARRLVDLGFPADATMVTGNLKFDAAQPSDRLGLDTKALLKSLGVADGAPILVAGSTHAGEEALLAGMFLRLRHRFPDLFLVLVPRHVERTREVAQALEAAGVTFALRSEMEKAPAGSACLLVNTNGELRYFYEAATVVFVGKSLTADGGQNPIEPAALGKAVVFGPNMQNFLPIVRAYTEAGAVVQAPDAAGVEAALAELFADPQRRADLGARARAVTQKNLGATERTAGLILSRLDV